MSDLQRAWAKAKLSDFAPQSFDEADEEEETDAFEEEEGTNISAEHPVDDDSSSASSASSTGTIMPSPNKNLFARPLGFVTAITFLRCAPC